MRQADVKLKANVNYRERPMEREGERDKRKERTQIWQD